ncbi:keratin-associated protein 19-2-like [Macrosteles quadrilineatus]|uniref:keratin-associated protein 19-2-like n=1 Tax=Macrosteles quadrilineatus TaxID=74068 RepID=UPI0023E23E13|nr:keratin-associated protein 19-2-like [Macrosteles quadrilineatus]
MRTFVALFGVLLACQAALAGPTANPGPNYGGGWGGYGGYGYGGYGVAEVIAEPVIPLGGGVVDVRGYVDSYFPGSSYEGFGTYGPAYGGLGYPLEVYGIAPYGYGGVYGGGYGGW